MKVLCVFGKYQYGDPTRGIGTEYAAFVPALERLGHQVIHFDSWEKTKFANYAELNQALLQIVEQERPDVMLTIQRDYEIWLETLQIIQSRGDVATISWTTDDSWKYREVSRFIGTAYHAMTTTYSDCVPKYHQDGIPNVLLTQWAANSEMLQQPLPASQCRYQVSFVGAAHGDRQQRIAELQSQGIEVICFGHGWANGSVAAEEIPRIVRESVISLNFANAYKGSNQVKARTFEVPGAGGFLLTEYALGLECCYIFGEEIAVFYSAKDLAEKIKYFLAHPEKRDVIAQAGFMRTKSEHTYDLRMKELLDFAIKSRDEWLKNNTKSTQIAFESALAKHRLNSPIKLFRTLLVSACTLVYGQKRGFRAARRLLFEVSWRLFGNKNFTASGLPGRLFPYQ
ncbi:MAG: glycosyltransferase [Cyanomargarita calcarea GSE-NOS-MK-12-04C]|jgi:spore maturation protein CgeB|uniref:Glycosyltransferase n=1 Tax=Cyanomargarita calcarea GSE-NOS-MK-12-04C TaxID=2839659 RepID=A0A951USL5_9CYAN|nr:glycosyltransferase [Cyanomargarita calcarea GSE-NOS-MK-12-04C]